jgi:hypothetical protein
MTVNEALGQLTEVIGELIAGVGDRRVRREMIADVEKILRRQVITKREERLAAGMPDYPVIRMN